MPQINLNIPFTPEHPEMTFYVVGGYVRDLLMTIPSDDIDFAVEAESFDALLEYVYSVSDNVFQVNEEYFTILAMINGAKYDFVLCRKDGEYSDGRRPDNVEMGTILDDLARRDFTMNAIAVNVATGEIIDPYHGVYDIEDGILYAVENVLERFVEDSLRMIRAIRFAITKGVEIDFTISRLLDDDNILDLLVNADPNRIFSELRKAFKHNPVLAMMTLSEYPALVLKCAELGVNIVPSLKERDN